MARRYDHTQEELTEMAIQAGLAIIEEQGFSGLSTRGVAKRIGYTVGTLYHLFGSLDHFILHLNARTLDEWHTMLTARVAAAGGSKITSLALGYLEFSRRHPHRFMALFEHRMPGDIAPEWYKPKMAQLFTLVEDAILPEVNNPLKARHIAKALWASVHGIAILSLTRKLELVEADSAERLIETVLSHLLPPQQSRP